jgi:hypothetical protein
LGRYARLAVEAGIAPLDLTPTEQTQAPRRWVCPVIEAFGKVSSLATLPVSARALRRASLSQRQQQRIGHRELMMFRARKLPHEFRDDAKLFKSLGPHVTVRGEVHGTSERMERFQAYPRAAARAGHERAAAWRHSLTPAKDAAMVVGYTYFIRSTFTAVIERDADTVLLVGHVPGMPGGHSQGQTLDELNRNLREAT